MQTAKAAKTDRLEARVKPGLKRLIKQAADLRGTSVTNFIEAELHQAAVETIRNFETLELQGKAREVFVAALLNPPEPNEAAKAAVARYRELIRS